MKKINTYSTQYKIMCSSAQSHNNKPNPQSFARSSAQSSTQNFTNKKTLSKDRQEFINNISASGFKQFNL